MRAAYVAAVLLVSLVAAFPVEAQVPRQEFAARRARLVERFGEGVYYFEGAPAPRHDYEDWSQEAYFHYLTGFDEPDARLLMIVSGDQMRELLFVRERDPDREIWEGFRLGARGATERTGIEARPLAQFDAVLDEVLDATYGKVVSLAGPAESDRVSRVVAASGASADASGAGAAVEWVDPVPVLRRLRAQKSVAEMELLQMASRITAEAQVAAMQAVEPGMNEFEIEALIEYHFRRYGARGPGFTSIVGSGPNSTTLHYSAADRFLRDGDMLVMDVGAEYGHYTTDITRSIPVSGEFSPEQRQIYEIVLEAQLAAEEVARERGVSWRAVSRAASRVLAGGLARLGLIEAVDATLPDGRTQLSLYYMHGLGHGIGLDVHDPHRPVMEPGNAFTIEPGLYIREDALDRIGDGPGADALRERLRPTVMRYREIGIRIEDAYVYTEAGLERLSATIPRRIEEIEATMSQQHFANHHREATLVELYREFARGQRHE